MYQGYIQINVYSAPLILGTVVRSTTLNYLSLNSAYQLSELATRTNAYRQIIRLIILMASTRILKLQYFLGTLLTTATLTDVVV
jgi:hypothetical protein